MFVFDLILLALLALILCFRIYFKNRLRELLCGGRYRELLDWLKKYRKLWPVNPGFSFWAARAAYFYGDPDFFQEATAYSLRMKRTRRSMRYVLLCYDAMLAFQSGNADSGMRKYREVRVMKPGKTRKWLAGTVDGMTDLLDGIASYHEGNPAAAKEKLLPVYGKFLPGISKSVCSRYPARIFTESGNVSQGRELLRWARAYAAGTLYASLPETPPEDASLCQVHPGQSVVGNCRLCGAPVCMKCLSEHRDQICRECFQKTLRIKKLTENRKDARNYLIVCTSMVSGLFNGIWLFIRFIRNRSRAVKITLAVLSIDTFAMIYAAGVFLLAPAYLFYLGRYICLCRKISAFPRS